jgi:hypothetical protein
MHVLGLDPSLTQFGWAVHDTEASGKARCLDRGRFRTSNKMLFVERYIEMRGRLRDLIRRVQPDRMGIEFPVFNDLWSEGMYGLFLFACEAIRDERQDVLFLANNQIKSHAREFLKRPKIGGKLWVMKKPDMVEAARLDTGGGRWNHNEADAYLCAKLAGRFWKYHLGDLLAADLTEVEAKQFAYVHKHGPRAKKAGDLEFRGILYREDERFFRWSKEDEDDAEEEGNNDG